MKQTFYITDKVGKYTVFATSIQLAFSKLNIKVNRIERLWYRRSNGKYFVITDRGIYYCYWIEKLVEVSEEIW